MFGKKKKSEKSKQDDAIKSSAPKTKVKKKKGGMSDIFRESVLETILSDFQQNEQFIHVENGESKYVGLVLDTTDIGGLDKKSRKDEAKGSIIECINSGRIKTFISSELLDEECIVIIPEVLTLSAMDEFSLLTDASYELCYVAKNGDIELLGIKVTYKEIADIIASEGHIDDILGSDDDNIDDVPMDDILLDSVSLKKDDDISDDNDISNIDDDDDIPDIDDDVNNMDDVIPVNNDDTSVSNDTYQVPESNYDNQSYSEPVPQQYQDVQQEYIENPDNSQYQNNMGVQPEQNVETEIPADWINAAVTRKFYSEDLGLEVTTDPFDAQFMSGNPYIPFDENRPSNWLNDQLNEMSREANLEMNRLHNSNLFLMRERYFRLISMQCDRIQKDLDVNNTDTQYGQMKAKLQADHANEINNIDVTVAQQKTEMERAWKQKLQDVGMDAAREAQHKYRERNTSAYEAQLNDLESVVRANIDAEYQYAIHDMNERRREEALSLLDLSITEVLDEVSDMYVSAMEDERVRYNELQENMRIFRTDKMEDDIVRTNVKAEELRQSEKADQVLIEQTAKIQALTDEYNQKRHELLDDIDKLRKDNQARIDNMRMDNEKDLAREREVKDELRSRYDALLENYKNLDDKKEQEFEGRITEMKDEICAWQEKFDHMVEVHKRNNLVSIFFVIAAIIAAVSIGFIGGEYVNSVRNVKQQTQAIQSQYDNTVDDANVSDK